jgi:hypothetical protein
MNEQETEELMERLEMLKVDAEQFREDREDEKAEKLESERADLMLQHGLTEEAIDRYWEPLLAIWAGIEKLGKL